MQTNLQRKIKIASLDSKTITPKPGGKVFEPFTKYLVKSHDGVIYSTSDAVWFSKRKIGEVLVITYWQTAPTINGFGKEVVYNNLVTENQGNAPANGPTKPAAPGQPSAGIAQILLALKTMETNIIDAIRLHKGDKIDAVDTLDEGLDQPLDEKLGEEDLGDENLGSEVDEDNPF